MEEVGEVGIQEFGRVVDVANINMVDATTIVLGRALQPQSIIQFLSLLLVPYIFIYMLKLKEIKFYMHKSHYLVYTFHHMDENWIFWAS